jgi:periplasmic copper chaperone A
MEIGREVISYQLSVSCRLSFVVLFVSLAAAGCTDRVAAGHQLYQTHGCATCHGANGTGDGPSAPRLFLPPTDFTNASGYRDGSSAEDIARTIRFGPSTQGVMPPFGHISEDDAAKMAEWIVSLQQSDLSVHDAWIRETSESRTVSTAYLTIDNRGSEALTLIGVTVEGAGRAELHTVANSGGNAQMQRVESLKVPAGSSVSLEPGGTHLMVFDVNPPLLIGNPVTVTLTFDNKRQEQVRAVVRPLAAMSAR